MDKGILSRIRYIVGNEDVIEKITHVNAIEPFSDTVLDFLSSVSKMLMADKRCKTFSDVMTFAFWIRKASLKQLQNQHCFHDDYIHLGRGVAFHIAPSNVPVNFAYSLVVGLLTGNANIIRVPSREFPQVEIICEAIQNALIQHEKIKPYISLISYEHDRAINDELSQIADIRVIWGGDQTIAELRRSPLPPRGTEITFADRFSIAVIDADIYLNITDKEKVALDFYNDTYFSDQNACTSPRIVIWHGNHIQEAKDEFWRCLHTFVSQRYLLWDIKAVDKLITAYLIAVEQEEVEVLPHTDNLIIRVQVHKMTEGILDRIENSGFFYEYDCGDVMEIRDICDDKRCQTVAMIGDKGWIMPLISKGVKGIDRVVEFGHTMDFGLIWDGYDLMHEMTRIVRCDGGSELW